MRMNLFGLMMPEYCIHCWMGDCFGMSRTRSQHTHTHGLFVDCASVVLALLLSSSPIHRVISAVIGMEFGGRCRYRRRQIETEIHGRAGIILFFMILM